MAAITMQRDLVITLKRETLLNIGILGKLNPIPFELSRQIFKENALEKPTQNIFNHLSYYLVTIIDFQAASSFTWPLYDSKRERTYRNELSVLISDYSNKGLLSPVMSSYLVNPGCYKVTFLIFQLSQLAVQRMLMSKMKKDHQKKLYSDMTEKYKSQNGEGFTDCIIKETETMLSKFYNYLNKRRAMEEIAGMFRKRITDMEDKLLSTNAQEYVNSLVDEYVKQNQLEEKTKAEILRIKNVNQPSQFFESWLVELDKELDEMETRWDTKNGPFSEICRSAYENTEALIARQTGEVDKRTFMIEYNRKTDEICTKDLQNQVSSQQKYILKNIIKDNRLNFPNLIRGFLVSICFILKNTEIGDEIYQFNEYLDGGRRNYSEIVAAMRILVERVLNAESRLLPSQLTFNESVSVNESGIPPLPDLSDIKMNRDFHPQVLFETFTPLNLTKHQFNLRRKMTGTFTKPLPRSMLITPFHHGPSMSRSFLQSVISCRFSAYDRPNTTQSIHNISVISQATNRGNETIAECSSGFTKQQICRLLSTKKTSSTKKHSYKIDRPDINVKKGGLFNESNFSNESISITRSHSSPNLFENREKRSRARKLSVMKEGSPSHLEVSGIAALERDSNHSTPQSIINLPVIMLNSEVLSADSPENLINNGIENPTDSQTVQGNSADIYVIESGVTKQKSTNICEKESIIPRRSTDIFEKESSVTQRNSIDIFEKENIVTQRKSKDVFEKEMANTTPKPNTQLIKKSSSLEKIINRFKKVRASILPIDKIEDSNEFKTIVEEKENLNSVNVDVFTANRILLPDLLSPSCSFITQKSSEFDFDSDEEKPRKPRESLGTALGVDHTFLDQFDFID